MSPRLDELYPAVLQTSINIFARLINPRPSGNADIPMQISGVAGGVSKLRVPNQVAGTKLYSHH
jgi:hypothetical protein